MANIWIDVDTAVTVPVNVAALIDDTDFKTREESVAFDQAGLDLVWNFVTTAGVQTQTAVTPTDTGGDYDWVNVGNGMYNIEIPASGGASIDNDAEGFGWFSGFATGILPWIGPIIGFRAAALNNLLIDANGLDAKLDRNADLGESRRGHHQWSGNVFYVDPVNGDDATGDGSRALPYEHIQEAHDDLVTPNNHDVICLVPGAGGGITTHSIAGTTTISKGRTLLRGPGSDGFIITRTGAGDTLAITGDGCEVSGAQIGTAASGAGDGIDVTGADRVWIHDCTFLDTQGDGVHIQGSSKCRVEFCLFDGTGVGGSGQGIHITGTGPTTSNDNVIHSCHFARTGGDSILIEQGTTNDTDIHHNAIHDAGGWGINIGASSTDAIVHSNVLGNNTTGNITDAGTDSVIQNNEQWGKQSLLVYGHFAVHIDDVDGASGSVEGTNGTQGNPVDNLADAVTLTAGLGIKDYELHGSTDIILTSAHTNWHFTGHNGSSVDPDGQNINGAHFDCLTLTGDLGGDDISARFCKLQSLTNATGSYDFCQLIDNVTLVAGDTHFFQCASGVAGTGTPYIDLDGDDANARNLHLRGWFGGVELRTHTSTDTTSFDCPAGQIIVAASGTGGTVAMRGNINITDNASGAVAFSQNAAVNMSKINAEVDTAITDNLNIAAGIVESNLKQIDDNPVDDNTATLKLKQLDVTNSAGNAVNMKSTGGGGVGLALQGHLAAPALQCVAGSLGSAITFVNTGTVATMLVTASGSTAPAISVVSSGGPGVVVSGTTFGIDVDASAGSGVRVVGTVNDILADITGAISTATALGADAVDSTSMADNTITAAKIATDAINKIADGILSRDMSNLNEAGLAVENSHTLYTIVMGTLEFSLSGSLWSIFQTDGVTLHQVKTVVPTAGANPVTGVSG